MKCSFRFYIMFLEVRKIASFFAPKCQIVCFDTWDGKSCDKAVYVWAQGRRHWNNATTKIATVCFNVVIFCACIIVWFSVIFKQLFLIRVCTDFISNTQTVIFLVFWCWFDIYYKHTVRLKINVLACIASEDKMPGTAVSFNKRYYEKPAACLE